MDGSFGWIAYIVHSMYYILLVKPKMRCSSKFQISSMSICNMSSSVLCYEGINVLLTLHSTNEWIWLTLHSMNWVILCCRTRKIWFISTNKWIWFTESSTNENFRCRNRKNSRVQILCDFMNVDDQNEPTAFIKMSPQKLKHIFLENAIDNKWKSKRWEIL